MKYDELKAYKADVTIPVYGTIADAKVYLKEKADAAIAELKAKLESVQANAYAESVDVGMENRRLKRALWIARAQAADGFATISRWTDYEDMHPDTKIGYRKWYKKFMHVKALCKAKAEEYK